MNGHIPTITPGRTLGHEGIAEIVEAGQAVKNHKVGDVVLLSCITGCGRCVNCARGFQAHCLGGGGWLLGNQIDGCQAEYVRVPLADGSVHALPKEASTNLDAYVMLSDVLPTALEVGVLEGQVREGKTVAVVGAGPVGLGALMTAKSFNPSKLIMIDIDDNRLEVARALGATHTINNQDGSAAEQAMELVNGTGIDVCVEAIGLPVGWQLCEDMVAAGGNIAILGVHGKHVTLHLERMWKRNFTLTAGLVHTSTIPALMKRVVAGELNPNLLISHKFKMSEMMKAYDTFGNAAKSKSLKVIIENDY